MLCASYITRRFYNEMLYASRSALRKHSAWTWIDFCPTNNNDILYALNTWVNLPKCYARARLHTEMLYPRRFYNETLYGSRSYLLKALRLEDLVDFSLRNISDIVYARNKCFNLPKCYTRARLHTEILYPR
mgnify:CR=1 FL=1